MSTDEKMLEEITKKMLLDYYAGNPRIFFSYLHPDAFLVAVGQGQAFRGYEDIRTNFNAIEESSIRYHISITTLQSWEITPGRAYGVYLSANVESEAENWKDQGQNERFTGVWRYFEKIAFPDGKVRSGWFIVSMHCSLAVQTEGKNYVQYSMGLLEKWKRQKNLTEKHMFRGLNGITYYEWPAQIIRAEAERMYITIHLANGEELIVLRSLNDLERELGENFLRVHRSHLVNIDYVMQVKNYKMMLRNGRVIPIAQRRYNEIRRRFQSKKINQND